MKSWNIFDAQINYSGRIDWYSQDTVLKEEVYEKYFYCSITVVIILFCQLLCPAHGN